MDDPQTRMMLSFGRAYRMLEAWVQADLRETTRKAIATAFGASPAFKLVETLAGASEPMHLSEIAARSGATRREMSTLGSVRNVLERMELSGMVINVGSPRRPLYQMNLDNDESRLLMVLFESKSPSDVSAAVTLRA